MILDAMRSASLALIGRKPDVFFGATERFEQEIADLANEAGEDIAQYQDWQALQATALITGNGAITAFALPADYGRMMLDADVQTPSNRLYGYFRFDNLSEFNQDYSLGFPGGWIISGNKLQFRPAPTGGARFAYISSQWARSSDGTRKSQFDTDSDEFLLPERLLKLWLIWRYREQKKLDASGDQEAFIKALDEYAAKDGGSKVYRYGGTRSFPGTYLAYPYMLG